MVGRYFQWLSSGGVNRDYFQNREFSFTLKDDIYVRYKSFADKAEMEKGAAGRVCGGRADGEGRRRNGPPRPAAIKDMCPYKIDIGAVFTAKVRGRWAPRGPGWVDADTGLTRGCFALPAAELAKRPPQGQGVRVPARGKGACL